MAGTSVLKLVVDDKQYEASLKNARQGMLSLQESLQAAGKTFSDVDGKVVEYARAIGQMDTVSKTAKGRIGEMSQTFVELKSQYQKMTDAEKQSPLGQAMSKSLEELKTRTINAKQELADINKELNETGKESTETGGFLGQLSDKFTLNIDAIKLFNIGLQAAEGVLGIVSDAFFKNEEQLDAWGEIVESSKSLYSGFLDALNTGDISGYLDRIGEITRAAQNAYKALDALNTFNAFNQVNVEKTRTGMTESIADYRSGQGSKEQVKAAGAAYQKELRERQKLEKQAYLDAIKKVAAERGVNGQDLITALSGSYGSYETLKAIPMSGTRTKFTPGGMFGGSVAYEEAFPANRQEQLGAALRKLNDTELQSLQALGAQAERTGNEIAQVDKQLTRVLNGRQPGVGGGGSGAGGRSGKGFDESSIAFNPTSDQSMKYDPNQYFQSVWEMIGEKGRKQIAETKDKQWDYGKDISGQPEDVGKNTKSMAKEMEKFVGISNGMLGGINDIVGGLQGLGIEIPKELQGVIGGIQSLMSIVTGIAAILSIIQTLQAIQTTESTIKSIPVVGWLLSQGGVVHAASGYEVPGNYYSGDQVPALLNSGELVLNKAQQGNLASQLQGNGLQNIKVAGKIKGTDIILSIDRSLKLEGKQLLTWGR